MVDPQTIRVRFDCLLNLEMKDVMCMHVMIMNRVHAVIIHCSHLTCPYRSSIVFWLPAPIVYDSSNLPAPTMAPVRKGIKRQLEQDAVQAEGTNEVLEEDPHTPVKIKFDKTPGSYCDSAKKSQCIALWKRYVTGKVVKATEKDIENAQRSLDLMKDLPQERQRLFVEAFVKQGKTKDFAFVRDYEETWRNTTEKTNSAIEGYSTRIFF